MNKPNKMLSIFGATFLMLAVGLTAAPVAQAWWTAHANVNVSPTRVQAEIVNNSPYPIFCRGYAFGRTHSGHIIRSRFRGVTYPGRYSFVYVRTNFRNRFVDGWTNIQCRIR